MEDHIFQKKFQYYAICMNTHANYVLFISLIGACRWVDGKVGAENGVQDWNADESVSGQRQQEGMSLAYLGKY